MRAEEGHQLTPFELQSAWEEDPALRLCIYRMALTYPSQSTSLTPVELNQRLSSFASKIVDEIRPISVLLHDPAIDPTPKLIQYDFFGKKVDKLITHQGWKDMTAFTFKEGLIGEAYPSQGQEKWLKAENGNAGGRDQLGSHSRFYQLSRLYLYSQDSHVNLCPTSMQDGLIRTLELAGTKQQKERYLPKLLSRDPKLGWTAGQW